jgi:hypothetical protein
VICLQRTAADQQPSGWWANGAAEVVMLVIAVLGYKLNSGTDWEHVFRKGEGREIGQF